MWTQGMRPLDSFVSPGIAVSPGQMRCAHTMSRISAHTVKPYAVEALRLRLMPLI